MNPKKIFFFCLLIASVSIVILITPGFTSAGVHAQVSTSLEEDGTCAKCHEDLYFLHDTGNWFCIRESPMECVDCHGGNPSSFKKEEAHAQRKAHPIINDDIFKCQECHPDECIERVEFFDQTGGISQVRVAAPYTPIYSTENIINAPADIAKHKEIPGVLLMVWEIIPLAFLAALALAIYWANYLRHSQRNRKEPPR